MLIFTLGLIAACSSNEPKLRKTESSKIQKSYPIKAGKIDDQSVEESVVWDLPPSFKQKKPIKTAKVHLPKPDLSGFWVLNKDLSDDPKEKMKAAFAGKTMAGKGAGGRGKGEGRGRASGGRGKGSFKPSRNGRKGGAFVIAKSLNLKHTDPLLIIKDDQQHKQRVYTDFRSQSVSANGSINQKVVTASWEGNILVIETTTDSNPRTEQHYQLMPDLKQLSITTIMVPERGDTAVSIYSVYERAVEQIYDTTENR